jgi:hypothetical protein
MQQEVKDTVAVVGANAGAFGITLANINEVLTFISLALAIAYTAVKLYGMYKK